MTTEAPWSTSSSIPYGCLSHSLWQMLVLSSIFLLLVPCLDFVLLHTLLALTALNNWHFASTTRAHWICHRRAATILESHLCSLAKTRSFRLRSKAKWLSCSLFSGAKWLSKSMWFFGATKRETIQESMVTWRPCGAYLHGNMENMQLTPHGNYWALLVLREKDIRPNPVLALDTNLCWSFPADPFVPICFHILHHTLAFAEGLMKQHGALCRESGVILHAATPSSWLLARRPGPPGEPRQLPRAPS